MLPSTSQLRWERPACSFAGEQQQAQSCLSRQLQSAVAGLTADHALDQCSQHDCVVQVWQQAKVATSNISEPNWTANPQPPLLLMLLLLLPRNNGYAISTPAYEQYKGELFRRQADAVCGLQPLIMFVAVSGVDVLHRVLLALLDAHSITIGQLKPGQNLASAHQVTASPAEALHTASLPSAWMVAMRAPCFVPPRRRAGSRWRRSALC